MYSEEKLKRCIMECGIIEERNLLKYLERIILGKCKILKDGKCWVFSLPEEIDECYALLKKVIPGTIIDLSPVARCLIVDEERMYTLIYTY
jgi:hypothetical protein